MRYLLEVVKEKAVVCCGLIYQDIEQGVKLERSKRATNGIYDNNEQRKTKNLYP